MYEVIADSLMQVESDDEEKKALLIEENIQLLEESERVYMTLCNEIMYMYPNALLVKAHHYVLIILLLFFVLTGAAICARLLHWLPYHG